MSIWRVPVLQGDIRFSVWVSFAQIYNEQIFDLPQPNSKLALTNHKTMLLREDRHENPISKVCQNCFSQAPQRDQFHWFYCYPVLCRMLLYFHQQLEEYHIRVISKASSCLFLRLNCLNIILVCKVRFNSSPFRYNKHNVDLILFAFMSQIFGTFIITPWMRLSKCSHSDRRTLSMPVLN